MSNILVNQLTGNTTDTTIDVFAGHATDSTTRTNLEQGLAKAWARLESGTATRLDNFNVGSSTDNGTGDHTVTVTNPFNNTNYSFNGTGDKAGTYFSGATNSTARTTTASRYRMYTDTGALSNADSSVLFHGDLA